MTSYYNDIIDTQTQILNKYKFRRNIVTIAKVFAACALIYLIYLWATTTQNLILLYCGALIVSLVVLTLVDSRLLHIIHIASKHITLLNAEIAALNGDNSSFDDGSRYRDTRHPYTHDLDIFGRESLYQHINRTVTHGGADMLAGYLSDVCKCEKEIKERQEALVELRDNLDFRFMFLATGAHYHTPKNDEEIISNWQKSGYFMGEKWMRYTLYGANTMTVALWLIASVGYIPIVIAMIVSVSQMFVSMLLTKRISRHQRGVDKFLKAVGNYTYLVKEIKEQEFKSEKLRAVKDALFHKCNSLTALKNLKRIAQALDQRFNLLVFMLLDGLFMKSIHDLISLDRWKRKYVSYISEWINAVNCVDASISMANFSYNNPSYTLPIIDKTVKISAKELCHPMLKGKIKVSNDFDIENLHQLRVITGANMAGKSTFLRSVGINLVLASAGSVVFSSDFRFTPMDLFTSMRTTDDLSQGSSYFHAELMRLKQLIETAEKSDGVFIILDEILKGTNSVDKLNGSRLFLKRILPLPISGIIATHDLALGDLMTELPDNFVNLCFEIVHHGEDIVYDYKLKEGVSQTMNATILLSQLKLI